MLTRPSVPGQQFEWVPYCLNTKQDHFPFAIQLWSERDSSVGKGVEDNSHLPDREPVDIIVIESYLVEGKIFFWSM